MNRAAQSATELRDDWRDSPRWKGVSRPYAAEDVVRLRGTVHIEHTLARLGAEKLWRYLHEKPFVNALGALTGNQAMQQVKAGLNAIYLSGWQVAGDANLAGEMYPDQSLYPANSVPRGRQAHQQHAHARRPDPSRRRAATSVDYFAADRRGCGSRLRRRAERVRADEADDRGGRRGRALRGPAGVGQEVRPHGRQGAGADARSDRASSIAARLAADVCGVPTVLLARTDAEAGEPAHLRRRRATTGRSCTGERTVEGFFRRARARTGDRARPRLRAVCGPDLVRDRQAGPRIREGNSPKRSTRVSRTSCWPTTARRRSTGRRISTTRRSRKFQRELGAMGYKFQFITLAGFHALNYSMFNLAHGYGAQMTAFVRLQEAEFAAEKGFTARGISAKWARATSMR